MLQGISAYLLARQEAVKCFRPPQFSQLVRCDRRSSQLIVRFSRMLAPALLSFAISSIAHAQGTIDFSGAQTLMATFKTFAIYAGAIICFGGLIFAGIRMMSGRFQDAIPGLFGALFGAGVLGWGAGWIGFSQEYLDASSPRSQQIRDHLEKTGYQGPEAAQIAAHSTRDRKEIHSPTEVLAAHRQIAAEFGNQADRVVAEARERVQRHTPDLNREDTQQAARQAVTYARDRSFEREAVADERDLYRDALRRGMSETTYAEIRAGFEARIASGEFQLVSGQKHDSGRQFTTAETIRAEREILRQMQQGQGRAIQIMPIQAAVAHTQKQQHLNADRRPPQKRS